MRVETICHEIGGMSAADAAEVATAAIQRIGEIGREAGEAFKERASALTGDPHFGEGMGRVAE